MSLNGSGQEVVTVVEMDFDFCAEQYGVLPCTASGPAGSECFNTWVTCQDQANFTLGVKTIKFSTPQYANLDEYTIPSIQSVSRSVPKLNIAGRSQSTTALGKRGSVTITFKDHPFSDLFVDIYKDNRDYIATDRGTFWTKFLARSPYYSGRKLRVLEGDPNEPISTYVVRHYFIERIDAPNSNGIVTLQAVDALQKITKDTVPTDLSGWIIDSITQGEVPPFGKEVTGTAIQSTNLEYFRLGDEIVFGQIRNVGFLELYVTGRAELGTVAEAHEVNTGVDLVENYVNQRTIDVLQDLLVNYSKIDVSELDLAGWENEQPFLGNVDRVITEPQKLDKVIGQLAQTTGFYIWWDEVAQLIRIKAVRPETIIPTVTADDIRLNTFSTKDRPQDRATEVWITFNKKSPIDSDTDEQSYKRTLAVIDQSAASSVEYNEREVYAFIDPWHQSDSQAESVAIRALQRIRDMPQTIKFSLYDRELNLGDVINVEHPSFVDATGALLPKPFQIISKQDNEKVYRYEAIGFFYTQNYAYYDQTNYDEGVYF